MLAQTPFQVDRPDVGGVEAIFLIVWLALIVLFIVATVRVLQKAGYSGWWVLLGLIPLVNIVMYLVFAFSDWPVLRRARAAGNASGSAGLPPPPAPTSTP